MWLLALFEHIYKSTISSKTERPKFKNDEDFLQYFLDWAQREIIRIICIFIVRRPTHI